MIYNLIGITEKIYTSEQELKKENMTTSEALFLALLTVIENTKIKNTLYQKRAFRFSIVCMLNLNNNIVPYIYYVCIEPEILQFVRTTNFITLLTSYLKLNAETGQ